MSEKNVTNTKISYLRGILGAGIGALIRRSLICDS